MIRLALVFLVCAAVLVEPAEARCVYGGQSYSVGSVICASGSRLLCAGGGRWVSQGRCYKPDKFGEERYSKSVGHHQLLRLVGTHLAERKRAEFSIVDDAAPFFSDSAKETVCRAGADFVDRKS